MPSLPSAPGEGNPDDQYATLTARGKSCLEAGEQDEGLLLMARAAQLRPDSAAALNNLGVACARCLQHEDALSAFLAAIERAPGQPQYLRNAVQSAAELQQVERLASLLAAWQQALALEEQNCCPDYPYFSGVLHLLQGDLAAAEAALRRAYVLNAQDSQPSADYGIYLRLGYVLLLRGQRAAALEIWAEAAQRFPDEITALHNLATVALECGERDQAKALLTRVVERQPMAHDSRLGLACILLAQGNYADGWACYESRLQTAFLAPDMARFDAAALWQGGSLRGKSLLVWGEQGLGDQLQFIRYLSVLQRFQPDEVTVLCHPSLIALFAAVDRKTRYLSLLDELPPYDYFVPLMSLPKIVGTTLRNIPDQPYLRADPDKSRQWSLRLPVNGRLRVGLVWGGNPRRQHSELARTDGRRSITLAHYAPLWAVPGIDFYSLQKGEPTAQLADWPQDSRPLIDWTAELADFADTAALVMNLDLVISVDTSVVHLAGGLGKPVWVLSRLDGCWRWLEEREDSPWYPRVRLFRQSSYGDWGAVLARLKEALQTWVESHG